MTKSKLLTPDKEYNEGKIARTDIEDTPFTIVETPDGVFGSLGKYRLTDFHKTKQEAMDDLLPMTWNRVVQLVSLVTTILNEKDENK